jgi:dTDP-N-acetylfucosamine:lipid II N-acetylfucosaminyltransferase
MNVLHLALDEKFILFFNEIFSQLPGVTNRYIVRVGGLQMAFKHIEGLKVWRTAGRRYFSSPEMVEDLKWADCLIVHYLDVSGAKMLLKAPPDVATVWSGWGGDYYQFMPGGKNALIGEETARLIKNLPTQQQTLSERLRSVARSIKHKVLERLVVVPALSRVDYFSAPIQDDFVLLQKALGKKFTAEYLQLNYGSVEQTFLAGGERIHGSDILIGNSATPTNNHLEIFALLAKQELADRKLIVPLSYGDSGYRDAVIAKGRATFGERFVPICDFIPLPDYNKLISRCSLAIMNQRRQQALGNIGTMLYRGAKVFLDPGNPVYAFFKAQGAYVYPTSMFNNPNDDLFGPLSDSEISANREVLASTWGHDVVMRNADAFLKRIEFHRKHVHRAIRSRWFCFK